MKLVIAAIAVLLVTQPLGAAQTGTPEALARALQERYQRVTDFSADFAQTYRGGFLRTESREEGTLVVKRPGRMRFVYSRPERKELVATGERVYFYVPAERVAHEMEQDHTTTPALFLAGQGDLVRDFTIEHAESPVAGAVALKLTPRVAEPGYEHVIVAVEPATLQIRALVTVDGQGGESTLVFTNLRENRGVSDREFDFRPPRGVDVVRNGRVD